VYTIQHGKGAFKIQATEIFKNDFFFLKLFLKQELKKISGMFIKCFTHIMVAMATYFPQNFCIK
jgi:hypothetical protein